MARPIQLLVGLGNPGDRYRNTRHNAGEDFVRLLCARSGSQLEADARVQGLRGDLTIDGHPVRVLIPTTFMNRSGQAVGALANFFKIEPDQILIAYDELDLEPGVARFKFDGGAGGHNGIKDSIAALGNRRDFYRLRIGIGHPGHASLVSNYVLSKPAPEQREATLDAMERAAHALPHAIAGNWEKAMHQLHTQEQ